jgi:hypothetical protein
MYCRNNAYVMTSLKHNCQNDENFRRDKYDVVIKSFHKICTKFIRHIRAQIRVSSVKIACQVQSDKYLKSFPISSASNPNSRTFRGLQRRRCFELQA